MHLPDGLLTPTQWAPLALAGAGVVGLASRSLASQADSLDGQRRVERTGLLVALLVVLQQWNYPVAAGVSGHLDGAVLLTALVGTDAALVGMFAVLVLQALLLRDGGWLALGANYLNLGVLPVAAAGMLLRDLTGTSPRVRALRGALATLAGGLSGAVSCGLLLSHAGVVTSGQAFRVLVPLQAVACAVESVLTAAILYRLPRSALPGPGSDHRSRAVERWALAMGLGALVLAPLRATAPDALEFLLRTVAR